MIDPREPDWDKEPETPHTQQDEPFIGLPLHIVSEDTDPEEGEE